jgi:hypothetical protein
MKKLIASCGLALATVLSVVPAHAAPVLLTFTPSSTHVNVGDNVTINASISGLGAEILSGYDLNFRYNGALLNWRIIAPSFAEFGMNTFAADAPLVEGDLGLTLFSLESDAFLAANQADGFLLFSFTLMGIADGVTNFTLGPDLDFVGLNALSLDVNVASACIAVGTGQCVQQLPEPASLALVGVALLGALAPRALRRYRKTTVA